MDEKIIDPERFTPENSYDAAMRPSPFMRRDPNGSYVHYSEWYQLRIGLKNRTDQYNNALSLFAAEHDIVARIWKMFGSPSYEELAGRSLYDLIAEAQNGKR